MSVPVEYVVVDGVGVLTVRNPPVNALSHAVRAGLADGLARAATDRAVEAVVIEGGGLTFPAGADIREFGKPSQDPDLGELCTIIESMEKPVVAALHGTAFGGGLELSLAAHYRLARPGTRLGLPEVTLGLLPGAGGTQRLPRLVGCDAALELMLSGRPISAEKALEAGLIDGIVEEPELTGAAVQFASEAAAEGGGVRRTRDLADKMSDPERYLTSVGQRRAALEGEVLAAPLRIVNCVEAALLLPFEAGLSMERAAFEDLAGSDQSIALRHVFLSERKAVKFPELSAARAARVDSLGVIGGGAIGAGLAVSALDAGFNVRLVEKDMDSLEEAVERVIDIYDAALQSGRISRRARDAHIERLTGTAEIEGVAEDDLVIEAVSEDLALKRSVFADLGRVTRPGAILATASSRFAIAEIAAASGRPADVIGMHFQAPVRGQRLVEITVPHEASATATVTAHAFALRLGKIPVREADGPSRALPVMFDALLATADRLLVDGAGVAEVDEALQTWGWALGPFRLSDIAGLDASSPDAGQSVRSRLIEIGRMGLHVGRGWYRYRRGTTLGEPDPEVSSIIAEERAFRNAAPRRFKPGEIQRRCLSALVATGARLYERGLLERPSDIDVAIVNGLGFPRWRGGPMQAADLAGLLRISQDIAEMAAADPGVPPPGPVFAELIKNGRGFSSLDGPWRSVSAQKKPGDDDDKTERREGERAQV